MGPPEAGPPGTGHYWFVCGAGPLMGPPVQDPPTDPQELDPQLREHVPRWHIS